MNSNPKSVIKKDDINPPYINFCERIEMNTFTNFPSTNISIKWFATLTLAFVLLLSIAGNAFAQSGATDAAANETPAPGIKIEHAVSEAYVMPGESVAFTVIVTNTGNVALENVKVTNQTVADCAMQIGSMVPGQVFTYGCELTDIYTTTVSKVTAIGSAENLPLVIASAEVQVDVVSAVLSIVQEPVQGQPRRGDKVTMTYSYTNSGTGAAVGVQLVETVPVGTQFLPEASAEGWTCENGGVDAGTLCIFSIERIEAGESANEQFPFVVVKLADAADSEETTVVGSGSVIGDNDNNQLKPLFLPFVSS